MSDNYNDIINLPHHISSTHPQMSMMDRAAQFSSFAALAGYDAAINETGRLTDERIDPGEETKAVLDMKQQYLNNIIADRPEITVTYFVPDEKKSGGAYVTVTGNLKRIEECARIMFMANGKKIPIDEITDIKSDRLKWINLD